ncbi:unnamed protein product [Oppiella nova]|uniref:Uncharacterized protein n=1 Tax=Oppiella nova TaxID=334625 RepID=A0A7R9QTS9_9ACAR|nr:unnamed protein product [Oppiella nova]CAG2174640.1 unnamed protein product [Oppiella nova]
MSRRIDGSLHKTDPFGVIGGVVRVGKHLKSCQLRESLYSISIILCPLRSSHLSIGSQLVITLSHVEGLTNRFNDIVYKSPKEVIPNAIGGRIVCYFGGDVQDLKSEMSANGAEEHKKLIDYCLEDMTTILSDKWSTSHVLVIRANRFHNNTYAIYDNFVVSDSFGCPKHQFSKQSLIHLRLLLLNCFNQLNLNLDLRSDHKLVIIGFSKGCVVLNQMLHSFYVSLDEPELKELMDSIDSMLTHLPPVSPPRLQSGIVHNTGFRPWIAKEENIFFQTLTQLGANPQRVLHFAGEDNSLEMHFKVLKHVYWVDGGHSGGAHTWITSQPVLTHFATLNIGVHIDVSPYQVLCPFRPWIAKEENIFFETLTRLEANPQRVLHFAGEDNSLEMHFKVLKQFVS